MERAVTHSLPSAVVSRLPRVAIAGGGIGGLALAIALQQRNIPVTIYERDTSFHQRQQGYGLTLQQASKALKCFGFDLGREGTTVELIQRDVNPGSSVEDLEMMSDHAITSNRHVVHRADGTIVGEWGLRKWGKRERNNNTDNQKNGIANPKRMNAHIARQALRCELLRAAGGSNAVHWNHRLVKYDSGNNTGDTRSCPPGSIKLTFAVDKNETVEHSADILVGADGIRSAVREQLIGDDVTPLRYLDCLVVLGIFELDDSFRSSSELLDGYTVFQTADGTVRIYMMPYSCTAYMWQLSFPMDENEAKKLGQLGPVALKEEALRRCGSWHCPIPEILHRTPVDLISGYPVYDRELLSVELLESQRKSRNVPSASGVYSELGCVTLLGDAAHPMSPFKGQGANQALLDALSLARCIYRHCIPSRHEHDGKDKVDQNVVIQRCSLAIAEYEHDMVTRSAVKVQASAAAAQFLHTELAIQQGDVTRGGAAAAATK
jgi:salicylate hydroxylase